MDVSLTDEQREWQAATSGVAAAHAVTGPHDLDIPDPAVGWRAVLELGVPSLPSPQHAGIDHTAVESALAIEQFARHLSATPVVGQATIAPAMLAAAGAHGALDTLVEGAMRFAPAFRADLRNFGRVGEDAIAFDAIGATHALLLDGSGPSPWLAAVELTSSRPDGLDLTRQVVRVDAGTPPVDPGVALGGPVGAEALDRLHGFALTALAADLLGVMDGALADAVAYARDREQFGVPIGTFQAVQHLLADALVATEGARGCVWHAAWAGDHLDASAALLAARTAKAASSEAAMRVAEVSTQVFGGIAITWEHPAHLRLRRIHLDRQCLGDESHQHREIARARLASGSAA